MKTVKFVTASTILALGAFVIPAFAGQWTFGIDLRAGFGQFAAIAANSAIASLVAIPDAGSIFLFGTGLLAAGTLIRTRVKKGER